MKLYLVPSASKKEVMYKVRETTRGFRCGCPKFIFNDREPCKHINTLCEAFEKNNLKEQGIIEREETYGNSSKS